MEWAAQKRGEIDPKDILSILVNNPDERGEPATRELIGGILVFTFGAAYETSQSALNWTLLLLSQHPAIAIRLAEEIDQAVAGGLPSMDKIGGLPLLDGVVKEAMRLFPPIPIGSRRSLTETNLGDIRVPSGLQVLASAHLINRNPEIYRDPSHFHPERWLTLQPSPYDYTRLWRGRPDVPPVLGLEPKWSRSGWLLFCRDIVSNSLPGPESTITLRSRSRPIPHCG